MMSSLRWVQEMMTSDDKVGGRVKKSQNHDDVILECPLTASMARLLPLFTYFNLYMEQRKLVLVGSINICSAANVQSRSRAGLPSYVGFAINSANVAQFMRITHVASLTRTLSAQSKMSRYIQILIWKIMRFSLWPWPCHLVTV